MSTKKHSPHPWRASGIPVFSENHLLYLRELGSMVITSSLPEAACAALSFYRAGLQSFPGRFFYNIIYRTLMSLPLINFCTWVFP